MHREANKFGQRRELVVCSSKSYHPASVFFFGSQVVVFVLERFPSGIVETELPRRFMDIRQKSRAFHKDSLFLNSIPVKNGGY